MVVIVKSVPGRVLGCPGLMIDRLGELIATAQPPGSRSKILLGPSEDPSRDADTNTLSEIAYSSKLYLNRFLILFLGPPSPEGSRGRARTAIVLRRSWVLGRFRPVSGG